MPHIFSWQCSYYVNLKRKWLYGCLKLYNKCLKFKERKKTTDENLVLGTTNCITIGFDSIIELKRETTTLIFSAVTIRVTSEKHWFSSFDNSSDVVNTMEHFWRESLLRSAEIGNSSSDQSQKSDLLKLTYDSQATLLSTARTLNGRTSIFLNSSSDQSQKSDLLKLTYDSQATLLSTARTLHDQGQQIRKAVHTMNELHSDLRVAEKLVSDLDSWFGGWNIETSKVQIKERMSPSPLTSQKMEYSILVAKVAQESHTPAILVLRRNALEIIDAKGKQLYSFMVRELSSSTVHSPWDMTFIKRAIGKPDIKIHIVSTRLPFVLKTLETVYKYKPIYEDPPTTSGDDDDEDEMNEKDVQNTQRQDTDVKRETSYKELLGTHDHSQKDPSSSSGSSAGAVQQNQTSQKSKQISETEVDEISSLLRNMKSLALDIHQEQNDQLEQLDNLTFSVDKANAKIAEENWTVRKML